MIDIIPKRQLVASDHMQPPLGVARYKWYELVLGAMCAGTATEFVINHYFHVMMKSQT